MIKTSFQLFLLIKSWTKFPPLKPSNPPSCHVNPWSFLLTPKKKLLILSSPFWDSVSFLENNRKIQFFPKKQPFSIKEKEAQNGLDSMRSFFFGVTPSSHEKWSNPYRKWRLSGRSIFNFLVQKLLFFMDFHSNSLKCFIFFNDFSYKFTSLVRKTPDATTWFRIEKSAFFQHFPQNPHFLRLKKYILIYLSKCKFLANLSLYVIQDRKIMKNRRFLSKSTFLTMKKR